MAGEQSSIESEHRLPNNEATHEVARNLHHPARNYDKRHCDDEAEVDNTRMDLRLNGDGGLLLVRERYGGVRFVEPEEREEDTDTRLVVYDWHRDESLELTEAESRESMDLLSGFHTVDTETIRERAESAMAALCGDRPTHGVEHDLQHIHARAGGRMDELYPEEEDG